MALRFDVLNFAYPVSQICSTKNKEPVYHIIFKMDNNREYFVLLDIKDPQDIKNRNPEHFLYESYRDCIKRVDNYMNM